MVMVVSQSPCQLLAMLVADSRPASDPFCSTRTRLLILFSAIVADEVSI